MPDENDLYSAQPEGGAGPIQSGASAGREGGPIGVGQDLVGTGGGQVGPAAAVLGAGRPIEPHRFGVPGTSIESPGAYTGGSPVGGPSSLFNIGGAPIAILGGVFSGGLPIGGPVTQIFRSGGPVPNTLFISTLEPSGPIGNFLIGTAGSMLGAVGELGIPIGEVGEMGAPIGPGPAPGGSAIGMEQAGGMMIDLSGGLRSQSVRRDLQPVLGRLRPR